MEMRKAFFAALATATWFTSSAWSQTISGSVQGGLTNADGLWNHHPFALNDSSTGVFRFYWSCGNPDGICVITGLRRHFSTEPISVYNSSPAVCDIQGINIEVCNPFWPYVKCRSDHQDRDKTLDFYVEAIRQLLAAHKCVKPVFNPADEKLAAQLFGEHVELKQIEHAILLACARRYVALLNGTAVGIVSGLRYFSSAIQEVRTLQISQDYWQHLASRVGKFEQQWSGLK